MNPRVSVLVLAYNHGPYIRECLSGILGQAVDFPVEVLVGEDRSTDDTGEVVQEFVDSHPEVVRIVTAETNVGMHGNLRRLVEASTGEYLAFCEGDDYWHSSEKLASQVGFLDARPKHGAVHTDFDRIVQVDGRWRALRQYWRQSGMDVPTGNVFAPLLARNFIQTCTLVVRSELALDYLRSDVYAEDYLMGDWPLCLYMAKRSQIGYLPASTATYRRIEGSATNRGLQSDVARVRSQLRMANRFADWAGSSEDVRLEADIANRQGLLHLAVLAEDEDLVEQNLSWLDEHGDTFRTGRGRVRRQLLRTRRGRALARRYAMSQLDDTSLYCFDPRPPAGREMT